jgi:hypothetical protein
MEAIETKRIGKYKIEVVQDEYAESPDAWGNEDAFVVYDHRQFDVRREGFDPREIFDHTNEKGVMMYKNYFVFVLYAYIHSGVVLSVGSHNFPDARWDVSTTGFVLVKKDKYNKTEEEAFKVAESVTEEWNQYLSGDVYGYRVTSADDDFDDVIHSCWGFYGDPEYCMTEGVAEAEGCIENDKHGQLELEIK